jgi:hypothetical protein
MIIKFDKLTHIDEVRKFNKGIQPTYGKGTMKGVMWCSCNCCVGNLLYWNSTGKLVGFIDTECTNCGKQINFSEAAKFI